MGTQHLPDGEYNISVNGVEKERKRMHSWKNSGVGQERA